jgi:hypothetical protein
MPANIVPLRTPWGDQVKETMDALDALEQALASSDAKWSPDRIVKLHTDLEDLGFVIVRKPGEKAP